MHPPPTYFRNLGDAEAALDGGVAEEEGLTDREDVGRAPVEQAAHWHLQREGGREGGSA